jgi:hypothetical protein
MHGNAQRPLMQLAPVSPRRMQSCVVSQVSLDVAQDAAAAAIANASAPTARATDAARVAGGLVSTTTGA